MTYDFEYVDKTTIKKITKVLNFNYTSTYERIYFSCLEKSKENIDKSGLMLYSILEAAPYHRF